MAEFNVDFPEDFLGEVLNMENDELCTEMLTEAAPLLEESMKRAMKSVIIHEGESEMVQSVKSSKPVKTRTDAYLVTVGPRGYSKDKKYYDSDGRGGHSKRKYAVSNALKAIWKEYGIPGHQPPRPFLARAANDARAGVLDKLQEVYNRKVGAK